MLKFAALIVTHEKISTRFLYIFLFISQCTIRYRALVCSNVRKFSSGNSKMLFIPFNQ